MKKYRFKNYLEERKGKKSFVAIIAGYVLFCIISAIFWCVSFNFKKVVLSLAFIAIVPLIFILEYISGIRMNELLTSSVLFLPIGAILGFCFNLYITLPWLDTLMHVLSGMIFTGIGISFAEKFFGKPGGNKRFYGYILFAVCFSISISVFWEFYEYISTTTSTKDMMADTIVNEIHSGILSGIHAETLQLDGITKTVIYYGNGESYVINGYLDIGLIDTMTDLIACTVGTAAYAVVALLSYMKLPKFNAILIPRVVDENADDEEQLVNV